MTSGAPVYANLSTFAQGGTGGGGNTGGSAAGDAMASITATSFVVDIYCPGFRWRRRKRRPRRRRVSTNGGHASATAVGTEDYLGFVTAQATGGTGGTAFVSGTAGAGGTSEATASGNSSRRRGRVGEPDHRSGLGRRRGRRWTCWAPTAASAPNSSLTNAVHGTTPGDLQLIQIANGGGGGGWTSSQPVGWPVGAMSGAAGNGGSASSTFVVNDGAASSIEVTAGANGGAGG